MPKPIEWTWPEQGYDDNPAAIALMAYQLERWNGWAALLEEFYTYTDPDTAPDEALDWLAYLVLLAGAYWDTAWSPEVKRVFIKNANWLWERRGTQEAFEFVVSIHNLEADIWLGDRAIRLPFRLPGTFGSDSFALFVRVPPYYLRNKSQWVEIIRSCRNWLPAALQWRVCYSSFILGQSVLGDPIFDVETPTFLELGDNLTLLNLGTPNALLIL